MRHQKQEIKLKKLRQLRQQVQDLKYYKIIGKKTSGYNNYIVLSNLGLKQKNKEFLQKLIKLCFEPIAEYNYDPKNYNLNDLIKRISIDEYNNYSKLVKSFLKIRNGFSVRWGYSTHIHYTIDDKYLKYFEIYKTEITTNIYENNTEDDSLRTKIYTKMKREHGWEKLAHSNIHDDWDSTLDKHYKLKKITEKEYKQEIEDVTNEIC